MSDLQGVALRNASTQPLKKLSKQCYDLVYFEPKGQLFYDDNCNRKGWGNSNDGGLVLTLKNKPKLTVEHLGFGEILA